MKLVSLLHLVLLTACGTKVTPPTQEQAQAVQTTQADKTNQPLANKRLSLDELREIVRKHVYEMKPTYNREAAIEVADVTPAAFWAAFGLQLVHWKHWSVTFVVNGTELIGLGNVWPNSILVTDLNKDRNPECVFMYTDGSGIVWSYIEIMEKVGRTLTIQTLLSSEHGNFAVPVRMDNDEVGVFDTEWECEDKGWTASHRIATIRYSPKVRAITATLRTDLPERSKSLIRQIHVNGEKHTYQLR